MFEEKVARLELLDLVGVSVTLHVLDELIRAIEVHEAERAAPERREAEAEDAGDITVRL